MGRSDQKAVTFINHYGALLLKRRLGDLCCVRAVPRSLSSSCGTCAFVDRVGLDEILRNCDMSLLECVYDVNDDGGFERIYDNNS